MPAARLHHPRRCGAHRQRALPSGRYFYEGKAFRVAPRGFGARRGVPADRPGGVRARRDAPERDAEIAGLAWRAAAAGGRDDLTLLLGDVGLFAAFVDALDLAPRSRRRLKRAFSSPRRLHAELEATVNGGGEATRGGDGLARLLAQLPEQEAAMVLEEIWTLAGIEPVGGRAPAEIVHRLAERTALTRGGRLTQDQADLFHAFLGISGEPDAALEAVSQLVGSASDKLSSAREAWARRVEVMVGAGVPPDRLRFSAAFGRAFGYYDGMVFEVRSAGLGDEQPVAAGGRYDSLPARLGASLQPGAVGCMVRPGRAWAGARP